VAFDKLSANLTAGCVPTTLMLKFKREFFDYGWEPDGSHLKWDNEKKEQVPITEAAFNFQYKAAFADAELPAEPGQVEDFSDMRQVSRALLDKLSALQKSAHSLLWVSVAVAVVIALKFWR